MPATAPPISRQILHQIMLNVMEEAGLYEIPLDLANCLPTHSLAARRSLAQEGLRALYLRGWLTLWQLEWPARNARCLPAPAILPLLASEQAWAPPTAQAPRYFQARPTDLGLRAWQAGGGL